MSFSRLHIAKAVRVAAGSGLLHGRSYAAISAYYLATILGAAFDGVGVVLLVSLVTGRVSVGNGNAVTDWVIEFLIRIDVDPMASILLFVVGVLLGMKTMLNIAMDVSEAIFMAKIRAKVQQAVFTSILGAGWGDLRDLRVGKMAATLIEEVQHTCKYMLTAMRMGYFFLGTVVSGFVALTVSPELTLLLMLVGLPLVLALRQLFGMQSRLSAAQTDARQGFAADVTERLSNLFQIKAERNETYHIRDGLRRKDEVARLEVKIGWGLAYISNFNSIVLLAALAGFYLWSTWRGMQLTEAFALLASVGMVGSRAVGQLNNAVASFGNLSRLAGSIVPVHDLISLPAERNRAPIPDSVRKVQLCKAAFNFGAATGLANIDLVVSIGDPVVLRGPSGSGKTTLANLIGGLYIPSTGVVQYETLGGVSYESRTHTARVGYVTQDVYLFHGSVRDNLVRAGEATSDAELWKILEQVGAAQFVAKIGGLDAELTEGGRSLSGGERRRLGIARVLASRPEVLILDEIMSGLDAERKAEIGGLIDHLAESLVVVAITHELNEFNHWREWKTPAQHLNRGSA